MKDVHLLEGGKAGQDGPSDPYRVLALWCRDHLDLHAAGCSGSDLLGHAVCNAWEHGGACIDSRADEATESRPCHLIQTLLNGKKVQDWKSCRYLITNREHNSIKDDANHSSVMIQQLEGRSLTDWYKCWYMRISSHTSPYSSGGIIFSCMRA